MRGRAKPSSAGKLLGCGGWRAVVDRHLRADDHRFDPGPAGRHLAGAQYLGTLSARDEAGLSFRW
jgi:hypothetical protein